MCKTVLVHCYSFCELVEHHHPKDLLSLEEFLTLRKQVITKPTSPLTVASVIDDDATDAAAAANSADELPPGVDDQPGSDASPLISGDKSKVCVCFDHFILMLHNFSINTDPQKWQSSVQNGTELVASMYFCMFQYYNNPYQMIVMNFGTYAAIFFAVATQILCRHCIMPLDASFACILFYM